MTDTPDISDTSDQNTPETKSSTRKKTTKKKTTKKTTKKVAKKTDFEKNNEKSHKEKDIQACRLKNSADQKASREAEKCPLRSNPSEEIDSIANQSDEIEPEEAAEPVSERDNEEASVDSESSKKTIPPTDPADAHAQEADYRSEPQKKLQNSELSEETVQIQRQERRSTKEDQ